MAKTRPLGGKQEEQEDFSDRWFRLVPLAELYAEGTVLTCDADFRLYRKHGRQVVPVLMPPRD